MASTMAAPASQVEQAWSTALQIEDKIKTLLDSNVFTYEEVEDLLSKLRMACEETTYLDFEYAVQVNVPRHLWDIHVIVKGKYLKKLEKYSKGKLENKNLVVERRKVEKHYVDFLKLSQYFYKGSIQRTASHFGMKKLERVAQSMELSTLTVDPKVIPPPQLEHIILVQCHETLLRLGDLSRYRNAIKRRDRSWAVALGYYNLANDLYPESGAAHNQMAVIALQDENHMDALYHVHRAILAKEPHPLARGNLEVQMAKIAKAWARNGLKSKESTTMLMSWFLLLQSKFYAGLEWSGQHELENEVLSRLSTFLKDAKFDEKTFSMFERFVLISVGAENVAKLRVEDVNNHVDGRPDPKVVKSYLFCLTFNARFLSNLCQVLLPELDNSSDGEDIRKGSEGTNSTHRERITAIARRVIPFLRQYCAWLASSAPLTLEDYGVVSMRVHFTEMWKLYTTTLTRLLNFFPVGDLAGVPYLLEEDVESFGFTPFMDEQLMFPCNLYVEANGEPKQRITDLGVQKDLPVVEIQARVRDILLCGLRISQREEIPVSVSTDAKTGTRAFAFVDPHDENQSFGLSDVEMSSPTNSSRVEPINGHPSTIPNGSTISKSSPGQSIGSSSKDVISANARSFAGKHGINLDEIVKNRSQWEEDNDLSMERMVDDLLETPSYGQTSPVDETSYGMHSRTANEVFSGSNGYEYPVQSTFHSTPKLLPSLPDTPTMWGTVWKPMPNELQTSSPVRPSTARQVSPRSPLNYSTNENRVAAARALEEVTERRRSRPSPDQRVVSAIKNSHKQTAQPLPQSSNFTDSSSIYGNTSYQNQNARSTSGVIGQGLGLNSTMYAGASDFDRTTMLQSSIWNGGQSIQGNGYNQTPPGGQGLFYP